MLDMEPAVSNEEPQAAPKATHCAHCNYPIDQAYCSQCGQKHSKGDPSIKGFFMALVNRYRYNIIIFFRTSIALLLRPKEVLNAYFRGDHMTYHNPFGYFLFIAGLATLITLKFSQFDPDSAIQFWMETYEKMGIPLNEGSNKGMLVAFSWMREHYNIILMATVPFFAFASWVIFKKKERNIARHLILVVYSISFYTFLTLPILPFISPGDLSNSSNFISFPIFLAYFAWVYCQYFKINYFWAMLCFGVIYILSQLSIVLFMVVIMLILGIIVLIPLIILKKTGIL